VDFRIDRRALTVMSSDEHAHSNRALAYWRTRTPAERVAAV